MFEFCRLRCGYAELHAPSSFGLDELLLWHNKGCIMHALSHMDLYSDSHETEDNKHNAWLSNDQ